MKLRLRAAPYFDIERLPRTRRRPQNDGRLLETVRELGGKKLFVKTEGTEQYLPTRKFYEACGFKLEAVLKEYYDDKDDCYIYSYKFYDDDAATTIPAE